MPLSHTRTVSYQERILKMDQVSSRDRTKEFQIRQGTKTSTDASDIPMTIPQSDDSTTVKPMVVFRRDVWVFGYDLM
jgi:hypothetical protein